MTAMTFDTLKILDKLKAAGFVQEQAEVVVRVIAEAQDELATKRDLKELELKFEARFEKMSGGLTLIKWMLGLLLAGVMSLILKAFF